MAGIDDATKATMQKLPLCTIKAGPRDGEDWIKRVKEEYKALIQVRPPVTRARRRPCSRAAAAPPMRAVPASQQGGGQRVVYDRGGEQDRHAVAGQGVDLPRLDQVRVRPGVRHSRELPERGARACAAGARRQDREDVPRRQGARRRHRCCCGCRCCAPPARIRPAHRRRHPRRSASTRTSGRCGRATSRASASRTRWRWAWARGSRWRSRRSSRWGGSSRRTKNDEITGQIR